MRDPLPRTRRSIRRLLVGLLTIAILAGLGASPAGAHGSDPDADYRALLDPGFIRKVTLDVGAERLWARGITGDGVDVALVDTGVVAVAPLSGPDKVWVGPDLSFERFADQLNGLDTYGHGTHMASIISGRDPDFSRYDPRTFAGVAPDSRIVSMKVADNTGAVDVSQVIAAIDWVVQYGQQDGRNVRVINLSYKTDSTQSYLVDPLARAVENAWQHGIVVVVAAGNGAEGHLGNPAIDPFVIAVGSTDATWAGLLDHNTASPFSAAGADRQPDLAAPGGGIVAMRVPGSRLDGEYPAARRGDEYFRGAGTSQAAAVVSGAVALLLEQRPELTPDQVKKLLTDSAVPMPGDESTMGAGELDVWAASRMATPDHVQTWPVSSGTGSLEASRGTDHVVSPDGLVLEGEITFTGAPFDSAEWANSSWSNSSWSGASWSNSSWSGASWSNSSWSGASWTNSSWSNSSWSNSSWSGASWSGSYWAGDNWESSSWSNSSWSGASWTNSSWSNSSWSNSSWSNSSWSGASWSNSSWSSVTWN
jgi:Subtilase family